MKGSLLYVDDEHYGDVAMEFLEEQGYLVTWYRRGKDAIDAIDEGLRYDLALVDLSLPDIGGDQVIATSKQKNPSIPVFSLSAYKHKALQADRHLKKPILGQDILDAIEPYIQRRQGGSSPTA
ncbi:MAG: response regulator [Candidatus Aenigmarchaeota archaeon]|nr:response regulator [Candidatus Aenigmarchaeota archaeon]